MELWKALGLDMDRHPMVALVGSGGKTTSLYALAREGRQAGRTVIVTTSTHMMPHPGLYLTGSSARESLRGLLGQYGIVTVGEMVKEYKMTGATDLAACKEEADLVLVEDEPFTVRREDVLSKCGWSPFEGDTFRSRIASTWVNGVLAWDGENLVGSPQGQRLQFDR